MIAYRKSLFEEVGANEFPKTWEAYREVGKKLKAKGYPIGQTAGHTFGDAPVFWYPAMWAWGGKEVETDGKVAINSKETVESVKFFIGLLEGRLRRGRARLGRLEQQPGVPLGHHLRHHQRRVDLHRVAPEQGEVQDRHGRADAHRHPARGDTRPGRPAPTRSTPPFNHGVMSYSKNQKLAKDFLKWWYGKPQMEVWFTAQKGFAQGLTKMWESHPMWQQDPVMLPVPGRGQQAPALRVRRPRQREGVRGLLEVHHHRHVREGHPGHAGRGIGEVGRGRAEEDLRRLDMNSKAARP